VNKRSQQRRTTQAGFIEKASRVHGDRYSYQKAVYRTNSEPVEIVCPEHGSFFQQPSVHLAGGGCPECGRISNGDSKRKSTAEFIEDARKIHQDRYSYQKTEYKTCKKPVIIECPEHGAFRQSPSNHLNGQGCPVCAQRVRDAKARSTTAEFVEKALNIHEGFYSYEKVEYVTNRQPVDITCPKHGIFSQKPEGHLSGYGCPACAQVKRIAATAKTTEQFIANAKAVHGDKYDYQKVNYINAFTPVTFICPIHGEFNQIPDSHLRGSGCPHCHKEAYRIRLQENFIQKSREMHGNRYGYDLVHYIDSRIHVTIVCPIHGPYPQNPSSHMAGHHCMQCYLDLLKKGLFQGNHQNLPLIRSLLFRIWDQTQGNRMTMLGGKHLYFEVAPSSVCRVN
jgi:Zn finger protein HypA/HybF involved in hydrogenase expression